MTRNVYKLFRPALARVDPEWAHRQTITLLKTVSKNKRVLSTVSRHYRERTCELPIQLFGRQLRNPVGLAAGFDKDGVAYPALAALGFGLIEIGTVTPEPQPGNPGVRIFRLEEERSIINRLGFNSGGLNALLQNLAKQPSNLGNSIFGINIGKNTKTPNEYAHEDYAKCLEAIYDVADYAVLNLSSPNSPGLRMLQHKTEFDQLLQFVMRKRTELARQHENRILPIAVKISPDLNADEIVHVAQIAMHYKVDALIATNSTTARESSISHRRYSEKGGLSGKLLSDRATDVIRSLANVTDGQIPIIGVGGISSAEDAWCKLLAGASAVQLYSALVFEGPALVCQIVNGLAERMKSYDSTDFATAIELARRQES